MEAGTPGYGASAAPLVGTSKSQGMACPPCRLRYSCSFYSFGYGYEPVWLNVSHRLMFIDREVHGHGFLCYYCHSAGGSWIEPCSHMHAYAHHRHTHALQKCLIAPASQRASAHLAHALPERTSARHTPTPTHGRSRTMPDTKPRARCGARQRRRSFVEKGGIRNVRVNVKLHINCKHFEKEHLRFFAHTGTPGSQ